MTTAPRTPETDKVYECENDANGNTKLKLNIANNNLSMKTITYDDAQNTKDEAESKTL